MQAGCKVLWIAWMGVNTGVSLLLLPTWQIKTHTSIHGSGLLWQHRKTHLLLDMWQEMERWCWVWEQRRGLTLLPASPGHAVLAASPGSWWLSPYGAETPLAASSGSLWQARSHHIQEHMIFITRAWMSAGAELPGSPRAAQWETANIFPGKEQLFIYSVQWVYEWLLGKHSFLVTKKGIFVVSFPLKQASWRVRDFHLPWQPMKLPSHVISLSFLWLIFFFFLIF